jgi:hypothetical protein
VVHKNGVETYVFQPRFCGSAREFGLVLPVPSKLSAKPDLTTTDVFSKLVSISQPEYQYTTQCSWGVGGSRGGSNGADAGTSTTVVSSGSVGFMDYAQVDTPSVDALTTWLTQNGYPYDAQATAAFDYYVQKGWYFLTFKVDQGRIDAGSGGHRGHRAGGRRVRISAHSSDSFPPLGCGRGNLPNEHQYEGGTGDLVFKCFGPPLFLRFSCFFLSDRQ